MFGNSSVTFTPVNFVGIGLKTDFTLSGKIIETIDRAGSTSRHTYTFQLSLNDTRTGYQVWQGEKEIGKQGTKPSVGF